jgi:hypothetical protein
VRIYRRSGDKLETDPATVSGVIELRSLRITVPLGAIYEDVSFEPVIKQT